MKHDWIRFRLVLPIVFGFLAAVLMTWDYENNRMVGLMGMGWDMGPPFWPYQAIYLLLFTINAPAFVLSMPILKLLNLQTLSLQYGVWFPANVGWWWWIGTRMDFGILGQGGFDMQPDCRRSFHSEPCTSVWKSGRLPRPSVCPRNTCLGIGHSGQRCGR
jgi:hypothetical protein